jgi:hypothetical protein
MVGFAGTLGGKVLPALVCLCAAAFANPMPAGLAVDLVVLDEQRLPVPAVEIQIKSGPTVVAKAETDPEGRAHFDQLAPGRYELTATHEGFHPLVMRDLELSESGGPPGIIELTLLAAPVRHEHIDVQDTAGAAEQSSSAPTQIASAAVRDLPSRPATVSDVLPLVPGVVRSPSGDLRISASGEHRSALIVNSADVTDPATGQFGLTVPIDSVESVNVYQTPFLAEFGRFTAGLVSVETRRGGDKWKWEINDPFPDFRIRSYHLRGIRDATPRLNAEGPLIPGKLYFSEGLEYEARKIEVYTLPFPRNQKVTEGVNSFAQLDWVVSGKQLVTATAHIAPQRLSYVNLDYFDPQPTVPDAATHNYTATIADRLTLWGGLLENIVSTTRFDASVWRQGNQDLTVAPWGNSGNYFAQQSRTAVRYGWSPLYSFHSFNLLGAHTFKMGAGITNSSEQGQVNDQPVNIVDGQNRLLEQIAFSGGKPFQMSDTEYAFFGQDHWSISSRLAADLGIRTESQEISESFRVAPRAGLAWLPFANAKTVVRAGFGLFFDRVPLNVYSFNHYPRQNISLFDDTGALTGGPYYFENVLGTVNVHSPWIMHEQTPGDFSPRSANGTVQVEQTLTSFLKLRAGYTRNESAGLVIVNRIAPDPTTLLGAYELSGSGDSRYHQLEFTARLRLTAGRLLFLSYVRSLAEGDLNEFAGYLGSFPSPIIRDNVYSRLPGDLPNRFLAWGQVPLPMGFRVAPILELRDGFPYATYNAAEDYAGDPYVHRYPRFFSLDSRFSKDIKVSPKYTVRLSVSGYNLSNHFNPEAFHDNTADPAYGLFFGHRGRRFTGDFDVLF